MRARTLLYWLAAVSLILGLATGCQKESERTPDSETVDTPVGVSQAAENTDGISEETAQPTSIPVINPLTGLPASDPSLLEHKPVFVKVSNYPDTGRPHAGLSAADMVFEYFIGSGQNRFMAVYYGQDADLIGPVRSGRRVDAEIVLMYGGLLGYGSADADTDEVIVTALGKFAISHHEGPCPAFCGEDTHDATGVFANSAAISAFVDAQGWENSAPDLPGMYFQEAPPENLQPAENLMILFNYYNRGEWRYDAVSGKYLRWIEHIENFGTLDESMEMIPLVDRNTGQQLAFSNILLIKAEYVELAPTSHEIKISENNSGRPAFLFRDGGLVAGGWATPNDSDPIQFTYSDGKSLPLKPGNTWVAIMGLNSTFGEVQPGKWESFFFLP